METPFVSVCMITYNHEPYIREAIEGVIMQKTDFPIELIIGEDCSTDNTRRIVRKYESQYPEIIFAQYPETNRGMINNFKTVLQSARGKYIALCEGDDYWTGPCKLQKQVDFLEANPEYSMCFHKSIVVDEERKNSNSLFQCLKEGEYSGIQILKNWIVPTASVMFRQICIDENYYKRMMNPKYIYGDIILFLTLSEKGRLFCLNDTMAVYRIQEKGVIRSQKKNMDVTFKILINHYNEIKKDFGKRYVNLVNKLCSDCYIELAKLSQKRKEKFFFPYILKALQSDPINVIARLFRFINRIFTK